MSQGDLLMQRKRHNNGEMADEDDARRYPVELGDRSRQRVPLRKSMAESPQFIETLKRNAASKGRASVCLTHPTSGLMSSGYAAVERPPDPIVVSREESQRRIIEERKQEEEALKVMYDSARSEYHAMLRERERIRLRQRTYSREALQERTLPVPSGSPPTLASLERESLRRVPQSSFLETNRDRMEVDLIRREEEREIMRRRAERRRALELRSGTSYALSQSQLSQTAHTNAVVTPEQAHAVLLKEEEERWHQSEDEKAIRTAMNELDALDEKLFREELQRREMRQAKKKELREASMHRK